MPLKHTVALVGRPNVGKSRLFNRLLGRRVAIVHDMPGVTRDLSAADVPGENYTLVDTGGIGIQPEQTPGVIQEATEEQVDFALQAAQLVLFLVDGREGCTVTDHEIADKLRRQGCPLLVVANKMEGRSPDEAIGEFSVLGLSEVYAVSAEHGDGIGLLQQTIRKALEQAPLPEEEPSESEKEATSEEGPRLVLCGRPNVGKSSLANALLQQPRLIVSEVAGTTRDAVETPLQWRKDDGSIEHFRLVDTAGLKPNRKLGSSLDYFSGLRTYEAIKKADIALLLLDARTGVTKLDKKIAGDVLAAGVGLIIVVNKWDYAVEAFQRDPVPGYDTIADFRMGFADALRKELFFLPDSPVLFVSATEGFDLHRVMPEVSALAHRLNTELPTGPVNRCLQDLFERQNARITGGRRFRIYYALQVGKHPFRIRAFCNRKESLDDQYKRYLQTGFQKFFKLSGCPIFFEMLGKPSENPYHTVKPRIGTPGRNTLAKHGKAKATKMPRRKKRRS